MFSRLTASASTAGAEDFVSKEVELTFKPGELEPKVVDFTIIDDLLVERTESFNVTLISSSVSAVRLGEPAAVNILDNDGIRTLNLYHTKLSVIYYKCAQNLTLQYFRHLLEAIIDFTSSVYDVNEDGKAVVEIEFSSGEAAVPVTIQ